MLVDNWEPKELLKSRDENDYYARNKANNKDSDLSIGHRLNAMFMRGMEWQRFKIMAMLNESEAKK